MGAPAIRVRGLGKAYKLGQRAPGGDTFGDAVARALSAPWRRLRQLGERAAEPEQFWALQDVSFDVQPGEVVGVIGANGAGKSTLLKILSRITVPTAGEAELRGSVRSLLEVGTGFHPELTGRENIYLNGAILGMRKREIDARFDAIVAFAEIERFLDTPVKRYSSGMYVRLAFAVAAHLEPEILVVDEVLAVGDAAFQAKCLGKMDAISRHGRTILFVSHNMAAVARLCQRALVLEGGRGVFDGPVNEAVERYLTQVHAGAAGLEEGAGERPDWAMPLITNVGLSSAQAVRPGMLPLGAELEVAVVFDCAGGAPLERPVLGVVIQKLGVGEVGGVNTRMTGAPWGAGAYERGTLRCRLPALSLLPGAYSVDVYVGDGEVDCDALVGAARFQVLESDVYGTGHPPFARLGVIMLRPEWALDAAANRAEVPVC